MGTCFSASRRSHERNRMQRGTVRAGETGSKAISTLIVGECAVPTLSAVPGWRVACDELLLDSLPLRRWMEIQVNATACFRYVEHPAVDLAVGRLAAPIAVLWRDVAVARVESLAQVLTLADVADGPVHDQGVDPREPLRHS